MRRIKELRESKGLNQKQLAQELGVSPNTISQYENGLRAPDIDMIKKLCRFFDVSAGYLIELEEI